MFVALAERAADREAQAAAYSALSRISIGRRRLTALRRILVGGAASAQVLASYEPPPPHIARPLLDAFFHQRLIRISYEDRHGVITDRDIEAQYFYYNISGEEHLGEGMVADGCHAGLIG